MGAMSLWHWLIVLLVVVLLFGGGKISGLMGDLGKGIKSFKKEMATGDDDPASSGSVKKDPAKLTPPETSASSSATETKAD